MTYKEIKLPLITDTKSRITPYDEVIIPLLKKSKLYQRGVAYFHSEWIDLAGEGLIEFVKNNGKIELLTSVDVSKDEYMAFKLGEQAKIDNILKEKIFDDLVNQKRTKDREWTLNYLSWLVANNIMEVKVSVHESSNISIYHDKISFFSNDNEIVCLHGSLNDSKNALRNQESIDVFVSWEERDSQRIDSHKNSFEKSWNGNVDNYIVIKLSDFIKKEFSKISNDFNPYRPIDKKDIIIKESKNIKYKPRDYQINAIESLKINNWNGILNMATGTGKTLTSLFAADSYIKEKGPTVVCIVAPQLHLVDQWSSIVQEKYGHIDQISCTKNKTSWGSLLFRKLRSKVHETTFIFTTYLTLIDQTFQHAMSQYPGQILYIFDECHKLGSSEIIKNLNLNKGSNKIGLSATPDRWLDEKGNEFINTTIGNEVFSFSLKDAIEKNFLVPYDYHIHLSELNYDEYFEFEKLSKEISRRSGFGDENKDDSFDRVKSLLNRRANISKKATSKFDDFMMEFDKQDNKSHTLVYVFDQQVEDMISLIKSKYRLNVKGIIASTPVDERAIILKSFNEGHIDVLVAIQCLDEGIDIPNCRYAYILASSTNPREFIQRRGRVLRKSKLKEKGIIHDFVTISPEDSMLDIVGRASVIKRELSRVSEFIRLSTNKEDNKLINYLYELNLLGEYNSFDPWEINNKDIEREEERNE